MRFAVLGQSREWSEASPFGDVEPEAACRADIEAEARRRKAALQLDEWRMREYVTGRAVPEHIRELVIQIDYAAQALARLAPIPADYADDLYWPRML